MKDKLVVGTIILAVVSGVFCEAEETPSLGWRDMNVAVAKVLCENSPTNCAASGCAVVYRVADGRQIATASIGTMSSKCAYESGNVVTPLTAIAAVEHGIATVETLYDTKRDDPRYVLLPGDGGHDWPEKMSVGDSLVRSSNIVLGKLGYDVGPKKLLSTFSAFGLGSHGCGLPDSKRMDKASWSRVAIGQGLLATPDEIARAYVILASRGKSPWTGAEVAAQSAVDAVVKELRRVVSKEGTAWRAAVDGTTVAGKTGTAQRIIDKKYVRLYNSTFAGFFPVEKPEYVVVIVYQTDPRGDCLYQGGGHAALAFSQIANALSSRRGIGESLHVEDFRTNEVSKVNGGNYSAFFESEIDLPDFKRMSETVTTQLVELLTGRSTADVGTAVEEERSEFFASCQNEKCQDGERFTHATRAKLLYQDNRYTSYRINYCHYSGCPCGAANEGETTNVTFDGKLDRRLCADDIVSKENTRKLLNAIRRQVWRQYHGRGLEFEQFRDPEMRTDAEVAEIVSCARKGDIGTVWVSDNFCLTANGIEWTFMPCEIVSASHGTITVELPWEEIDGLVKVNCVR